MIIALGLVVFLVLTEQAGIVPARYAALGDLPVFAVVYHIIDKGVAAAFGPFLYHSIAQLLWVHVLHSRHVRINLLDLKPLYAPSTLTAATAAGLIVPVYGWMFINPELLASGLSLGSMVLFTVLGLVAFVGPLYGAHRLIAAEKERVLEDIAGQFQTLFARLNQRVHDGNLSGIEGLNGAIASLEIQHRKIRAIPTWPWKAETARSLLGTLGLPPVLGAVQALVQRVLAR
jgi:hypothetical protein